LTARVFFFFYKILLHLQSFLRNALESSYSVYVIIYHGFEFIQFQWNFLKASDCIEEPRKDETCLQFKMNKYFIKTRKIYQDYFSSLSVGELKIEKQFTFFFYIEKKIVVVSSKDTKAVEEVIDARRFEKPLERKRTN